MSKTNHGRFFRIGGIDHERFVGIDKKDGVARDFYRYNVDNYRPWANDDELNACGKKAKEYYDSCVKKVIKGEFGLYSEEITEEIEEEQ